MKEIKELNLNNLVFIDIETARVNNTLDLNSQEFDAWKYQNNREFPDATDVELQDLYTDKASLFAEFAKIVCISVGRVVGNKLKVKTYNNSDERVLLEEFNKDLTLVHDSNPKTAFCGHAIVGFDIPFIFKRCMINQVTPNELLDTAGEKPWTVTERLVDTKDLWKGTGFRASSLAVLAMALGVPSPKDDISGADVGKVYYSRAKDRVERISRYCEKDVLTTANVVRRLRFEPLLEMETGEPETQDMPLITKLVLGGKYGAAEKKSLLKTLKSMTPEQQDAAIIVLKAASSTAKGKKTKFTTKHLNELKKEIA